MDNDMFGELLTERCHVHPWVPEPYPCWKCYAEWEDEYLDDEFPPDWEDEDGQS